MEKRTVLAFVLMALVLAISQYLLVPSKPPAEAPGRDGRRAPERRAAGEARETTRRAPAPPERPAAAGVTPYAAPGGAAAHVETPLYALTIERRGGVVTQAFLKRYPSFVDRLPVQLVPKGVAFFQRTIRAGQGDLALTDLTFDTDRDSLRIVERPDSLVLTARSNGGEVRQVYRFDPGTYQVAYRLEARGLGAGAELETRLGPRLRSTEKNLKEDLQSFAAVARVGEEVHTLKPGDVDDGAERFSGSATWAGIKSKYFLGVLVSADAPFDEVTVSSVPGDTLPGLDVTVGVPLNAGRASYRFYLGPQEFRGLAAAGASLEDVNQYGWSWIRWLIQPFAHVIVQILLWMHQYVPNYGVVLIIFGVLVRLLMWPLTQKSFESMQKMQAVQPELQRLRERYKNDPQRIQQEMMRIYRERGVNPLGGCLPNLLPLPVLFALFFVFQNTIEFRGAPFVGWIQDLSRPDPYYVLPILMGVTMFIQQKLTPTGDNPQMKMMTYFMPVFLTFIFLNLAAGLVLYYTVSNVLTFAQQLLLRKKGAAAAPAPSAAKS